jgi:hypothetical protein
MVKENSFIKTEECMMVNGFRIKCRDMESCIISLVLFILFLGKIAYDGQWVQDQFTGHGILYNENPDPLN